MSAGQSPSFTPGSWRQWCPTLPWHRFPEAPEALSGLTSSSLQSLYCPLQTARLGGRPLERHSWALLCLNHSAVLCSSKERGPGTCPSPAQSPPPIPRTPVRARAHTNTQFQAPMLKHSLLTATSPFVPLPHPHALDNQSRSSHTSFKDAVGSLSSEEPTLEFPIPHPSPMRCSPQLCFLALSYKSNTSPLMIIRGFNF